MAFRRSRFDTPQALKVNFTGAALSRFDWSENCTAAVLNDSLALQAIYLVNRGLSYKYGRGNVNDNSLVLTVGNVLFPSSLMNQTESDQAFREGVRALFEAEQLSGVYHSVPALPAAVTIANPSNAVELDDFKKCNVLLKHILETNTQTDIKSIGLRVYMLAFLSAAKMGNITDDKLDKVSSRVLQTHGVRLALNQSQIELTYSFYGKKLDETNAQDAFDEWNRDVGGDIVSTAILTQASGAGITAYTIVKKAMKDFSDFPWGQATHLLRADWEEFKKAVQEYGTNPFYGYKTAKTTPQQKFKSLTYVAKSLLVTHGGPDGATLAKYKGDTSTPLHKAALDTLLAAYTPTVTVADATHVASVDAFIQNL